MAASALPLKMCLNNYDRNISYQSLHSHMKRASPTQLQLYKHSLLLHKAYNDDNNSPEWLDLFSNQTFNDRNTKVNFIDLTGPWWSSGLERCFYLIKFLSSAQGRGFESAWCRNVFSFRACADKSLRMREERILSDWIRSRMRRLSRSPLDRVTQPRLWYYDVIDVWRHSRTRNGFTLK